MTARTYASIVGALLALGAFIALALPVSIDTPDKTVGCGNAFRGLSLEAQRSADMANAFGSGESTIVSDCRDAIGSRRGWGWTLVGIGVVVGVGGAVIRPTRREGDRATAS